MIIIKSTGSFFSKIKLQQSLARPDKDKYVICDKINTSCNSINEKAGPGIANINASNFFFHGIFQTLSFQSEHFESLKHILQIERIQKNRIYSEMCGKLWGLRWQTLQTGNCADLYINL